MRDGLKILTLPGNYGYLVTLICWVRRVRGDLYEILPGARTIWRTGQWSAEGLTHLASRGLQGKYKASEPSETPEEINWLTVRRMIVAKESAWPECPRPADWGEK